MNLIDKMIEFATAKHAGQLRKYSKEPYINHPLRVMEIVKTVPHDDVMLAAAVGHDLVEDCGVTVMDLEKEFDVGVALLVYQLTNPSKQYPRLDRETRKAMDRYHLSVASPEAQTIKYADMLDNVPDIIVNDPEFAKVYLIEKRADLRVANKGNSLLFKKINDVVESYFAEKHNENNKI